MGSFSIPVYRRRRARADAEPRVRFRPEEGLEGHIDLQGPRGAAAEAAPPAAASLLDSPVDAGAGEPSLQPVLPAGLLLRLEKEEEEASSDALGELIS